MRFSYFAIIVNKNIECNTILINFPTYFAQLTSAGRSTLSTLFAILAALRRHDDDRKSAKDFRFLKICIYTGYGHHAKNIT